MVNVVPQQPQERDLVSIVKEAGWAPGQIRIGAENFVPTVFEPWTIHPLASRYTDYTHPAHFHSILKSLIIYLM